MGSKRVLVIDDDPALSGLLEEFCGELGCDVKCVNDSRTALDVAREWKPDLITLDLEMPHKDGLEVLQDLRGDPVTRGIPVLIVSILAGETAIDPATVLGKLKKPLHFNIFLDKVKGLLSPATA